MKNKINTKDEADIGGVHCALSAGQGSPGDGKALEGQDPKPRNSRNNRSQSRAPGGPGRRAGTVGRRGRWVGERAPLAGGPGAASEDGGHGGWGCRHGHGQKEQQFPTEPWTCLVSKSSQASKPEMGSAMVGEHVELCAPHWTQRICIQQTAEALRSEGPDTFLHCS